MVLAYILFNFWACISGFKEGILYSRKGAEAFKWNEHILFVIERCFVFSLFFFGKDLSISALLNLSIFCVLSFSFWHNGFYYMSRQLIDTPKYHFSGDSDTSTAIIELNWSLRLSLKIFSLLGLVIYLIYK